MEAYVYKYNFCCPVHFWTWLDQTCYCKLVTNAGALTRCPWRTVWEYCWNDASTAQTRVSAAQSPVISLSSLSQVIIHLNEWTKLLNTCLTIVLQPWVIGAILEECSNENTK